MLINLKGILSALLLLIFVPVVRSQAYMVPFGPMESPDTLRAVDLERLSERFELIYSDGRYQALPEYPETNEGLLLIIEQQGALLAYQVYGEKDRNSSYGPPSLSADGRYFLVPIEYNNFTRGQETSNGELWIVDPLNATLAKLETSVYIFEWTIDPETEMQVDSRFSSFTQVFFQGNELYLFNACTEGDQIDPCADPGSTYEIATDALTRTMNYDPYRMCMVPVRRSGPIALGISFEEVERIYPEEQFWNTSATNYGLANSAPDTGIVVSNDSEVMCFIRMEKDQERIKDIVAISTTYVIGGVHTGMPCAELTSHYPDLVLRIDPNNGWELADIEEPSMRITFKTDGKNRVGSYAIDKATRDLVFKGIARPEAPIDLITISTP